MANDNPSLILRGIKDLKLEQRPIPTPGKNEVLLAIDSVGICGSDVHFWSQGRLCDFVVTKDHILGHEASGTVIGLGDGVAHLQKGDRVAIEPGVPCLSCNYCKSNRYNLCRQLAVASLPPTNGALCRYFVHPASFCYKIADNMSLEEAAVVEPVSVTIRACQRAGIVLGKTVLITGAGPIGLLSVQTAKAMGASKVYITDVLQNRLDFAKTQGADQTILSDVKDVEEFSKKILKNIGEQVDIVMECSGTEFCLQTALSIIKPGGVLQMVGLGNKPVTLPLLEACIKEIDIRGTFSYVNCYPIAIDLIASGRVNVKPLVTHRFNLSDGAKAFQTAHSRDGNPIKIVIKCAK